VFDEIIEILRSQGYGDVEICWMLTAFDDFGEIKGEMNVAS